MRLLIGMGIVAFLLVGCGDDDANRQSYFEKRQEGIQRWVPESVHHVCVEGVTYYYLDAGNGSTMSVALGPDSKVIACEVKQ